MKNAALLSAIAATCALAAPSIAQAQFGPYKASALHLLNTGGTCSVNAINASAQAVGACFDAQGVTYTAFATAKNGKKVSTVGLLPGGSSSWTNGLNDQGLLVGDAKTAGDAADHAFFFDPAVGHMQDLGTLGGTNSYALAINKQGTIVGESQPAGDATTNGFVMRNGKMKDLGTLPGGNALAPWMINSSGSIAGQGSTSSGETHAVYANAGRYQLVDMGTLGGSWSWINGLNDQGVLVGVSSLTGDTGNRAVVANTNGTPMADLGTPSHLYSAARAINNLGQVVGSFRDPVAQTHGSYICSLAAACADFTDLATLVSLPKGIVIDAVYRITDQGVILVTGSDGLFYLLQPK